MSNNVLGKMGAVGGSALGKLANVLPSDLPGECTKGAAILQRFLHGSTKNPDNSIIIPYDVIARSKGVVILTVIKVGFGWSGRGGSGLVVARLPDGRFSAPSAIVLGGAGYGLQAGASMAELVFVLNTESAVASFINNGSLTVGGQASLALGPGSASEAQVLAAKGVPSMYVYSKTKGLFAGVSFEGTAFITRNDANKAFYGEGVLTADLFSGAIPPPPIANALYQALSGLSGSVPPSTTVPPQPAPGPWAPPPMASPTSSQNTPPVAPANHPPTPLREIGSVAPPPAFGEHDNDYKPPLEGEVNSAPTYYTPTGPVSTTGESTDESNGEIVQAKFKFVAQQEGDLGFEEGDIIIVLKKTQDENAWWYGRIGERVGQFPANYVQQVV